jgi:hypothetical protein
MVDEWDKYAVDSQSDEWGQYATKGESKPSTGLGDILGGVAGVGAAAGAGYGLLKTGIPQKVGRGVGIVTQGLANFPKVINSQKGANFAKQVREAFVEAHTNKIAEFGGQLESLTAKNPTRVVSLQNVVDDIVNNFDEMAPEVKGVMRRTPFLRDMVKKVKPMSPNITLQQSQEIINYMNTKVPKNIRANNLDLLDTINNIKGAQLDAFPEMETVRATYKKFIEPYSQVKNYFKFNKVLDAIKNKFGGAEGQIAAEKVLPKQTVKDIRGYRTASKMAELPGDIPFIGRFLRSMGGMFMVTPGVLQAINMSQQLEKARKAGAFTIDNFGNIIPLSRDELDKWLVS